MVSVEERGAHKKGPIHPGADGGDPSGSRPQFGYTSPIRFLQDWIKTQHEQKMARETTLLEDAKQRGSAATASLALRVLGALWFPFWRAKNINVVMHEQPSGRVDVQRTIQQRWLWNQASRVTLFIDRERDAFLLKYNLVYRADQYLIELEMIQWARRRGAPDDHDPQGRMMIYP